MKEATLVNRCHKTRTCVRTREGIRGQSHDVTALRPFVRRCLYFLLATRFLCSHRLGYNSAAPEGLIYVGQLAEY